jgi:HPt (histidine-containing phosphotransfer) domain-containing protein
MNKMIQMFLNKTPDELERLDSLNSSKDYPTLSALAHTIKSKYKLMGMGQLAEIALEIESNSNSETNVEGLEILIDEITKKTELAIEEFNIIAPIK